jgi:hypothetical protein
VSQVDSRLQETQRARLVGIKARVLARKLLGDREWTEASLAGGAALHDGTDAVVLVATPRGGDPGGGLGPALAWAAKAGVPGDVHLLVEGPGAGIVARRAAYFQPAPRVWQVEGADTALAEPEPFAAIVEPSGADLAAVEPLCEAGADLVVEHGVVMAEILGLEVGRVVNGTLELGVGKHDRAAAALMEAVRSRDDVLGAIVEAVRRHRNPEALPHLLNRLARQRWLRASLVADPARIGASSLVPVEPPAPRPNLVSPAPAIAIGEDVDGRPLVVACSVGVDLDLVPVAADARARDLPDAELLLVAPPRDQYPAVAGLAARLRQPARMISDEGDWPS